MHNPCLKIFHPLAGNVFPAVLPPNGSQHLSLQYQLEKSQWLEPQEIFKVTSRQLRLVLLHAAANVPYYRSAFKERGIRIPKEITKDWFSSLPVLQRDQLQREPGELLARTFPREHGGTTTVSSSGSTGRAVTVTTTSYAQLIWRAFALREHIWHERDFRQSLAGIRYLPRGEGEFPDGGRTSDWGITESVFVSGPGLYLNVVTKLKDQISWILRNKPAYLTSFPSNLAALARHCLENEIRFSFLKGLRTVGETVTPYHRELFRDAWQVKAVDVYSCEEFGSLAIQCPAAEHYHVQSENIYLEIVDDKGRQCGIGEPGRVLITSLHNFAMPLIRYEIGDMAVWGELCQCGRGLPVLARILGRKRNRLVLPDGSNEFAYLSLHENYDAMTGTPPKYYQFVQKSLEEIEVRLVLDNKMSPEQEQRFTKTIQDNLGHPFTLRFVYLPEVPVSPTGKYETFVSEVSSGNATR